MTFPPHALSHWLLLKLKTTESALLPSSVFRQPRCLGLGLQWREKSGLPTPSLLTTTITCPDGFHCRRQGQKRGQLLRSFTVETLSCYVAHTNFTFTSFLAPWLLGLQMCTSNMCACFTSKLSQEFYAIHVISFKRVPWKFVSPSLKCVLPLTVVLHTGH